MALYSLNGSYPQPLPNRIRLSNGKTKTDSTTFTDDDLSDAGYTLVADAPEAPSDVSFAQLEWDADNLSWVYRTTPNETEINNQWALVRKQRDEMLKDADISTMIAIERNVTDPHVDAYKQELRSVPEVNDDPFNINWPLYGEADSSRTPGE